MNGICEEKQASQAQALYRSSRNELVVVCNLIDHFTIIYEMLGADYSLTRSLHEVDRLLLKLQQVVKGFAFSPEFGILTVNPIYSGNGAQVFAITANHAKKEEDFSEFDNGVWY